MLDLIRKMLLRFKRNEPVDNRLECRGFDCTVVYTIVESRGICLIGKRPNGGTMAIRESDAVDPKRFRKIWKRLNPGVDLRWEDGTRCVPPR